MLPCFKLIEIEVYAVKERLDLESIERLPFNFIKRLNYNHFAYDIGNEY